MFQTFPPSYHLSLPLSSSSSSCSTSSLSSLSSSLLSSISPFILSSSSSLLFYFFPLFQQANNDIRSPSLWAPAGHNSASMYILRLTNCSSIYYNLNHCLYNCASLQRLINCYGDNIVCLRYNQPPRNPLKKVCLWLPACLVHTLSYWLWSSPPISELQWLSGQVSDHHSVQILTGSRFSVRHSFFLLIGQMQEDENLCWSYCEFPEVKFNGLVALHPDLPSHVASTQTPKPMWFCTYRLCVFCNMI